MDIKRSFAEKASARATTTLILTGMLFCLPAAALSQTLNAPSQSSNANQSNTQTPANFSNLAKKETPAVVAILSRQQVQTQNAPNTPLGQALRQFYGVPQQQEARVALGSGFVIDNKGDIVTANHVIAHSTDIHVKFPTGVTEPAKIVGSDPETDIAVLRVKPPKNMTVAHWGNSSKVEPGDWVVAIGSPFGLGGTVTVGVLSARSRNPLTGRIGGLLQTDAAINKGNSGGPLFDGEGNVIGVNDAILSPSGGNIGIGFAVPSETAEHVANELMKNGKVSRGYIGAQVQDINQPLAKALGLSTASGALIAEVQNGSPAAQAGLQPGEVITQVGSHQISNSRDLVRVISSDNPGKTVNITVASRNGQKSFQVTLAQRPGANQQTSNNNRNNGQNGQQNRQQNEHRLGIEVAPYNGSQSGHRPNVPGLAVLHVIPDSPAAANGLQQGDIIVSADGQTVDRPAALGRIWRNDRQQNQPLLLRIFRDAHYAYLAIG